jgi:catechol 2,3-dioxygenase-like lactoylglutathione lyase family enzyme
MKAIHLAMTVRDTTKTLDFYCNILGGKILWEAGEPQQGGQTDTIFGMRDCQVFVSGIELHGIIIEFFEFRKPPTIADSFHVDYHTGGWKHLALDVDDVEAEVAKLKEKGVHFRFPIQTLPNGCKMTYFDDPDGIMLELIQQPQ